MSMRLDFPMWRRCTSQSLYLRSVPVHTPRPKPEKVMASILYEFGASFVTAVDVVETLQMREVKPITDAEKLEAKRAKRDVDHKKRGAAENAAQVTKDAILASEAPLRAIARREGMEVNDKTKLTVVRLKKILRALDEYASTTGSLGDPMTVCLDTASDANLGVEEAEGLCGRVAPDLYACGASTARCVVCRRISSLVVRGVRTRAESSENVGSPKIETPPRR